MSRFSDPADDLPRRFLIHCLAGRRVPEALETAALMVERKQVDWEAVWTMAAAERVAPLLYHTTRHTNLLPEWLLEQCHAAYVETGVHNTLRMRELSALLSELFRQGIQVIVLKGAALVDQIYGNLALRPMLDIDLLVRREDVRTGLAVLEAAGYRQGRPELASEATLTYENELFLWKQDRLEWHVELHWSLFDSPFYQERLPEGIFWETAEQTSIEGAPAYVLSSELMLLHLCGHLALHHRGQGILWQADVAELIYHERERLDWNVVLAQAAALNLVLPLQAAMLDAAGKWRAPIPPEFPEPLAALNPDKEEVRVYSLLTAEYRPAGRRLLDDLRTLPTWPARLRFLYHNLFPSAAYMDERYGIRHPALRPLYYLFRWGSGITGWRTH